MRRKYQLFSLAFVLVLSGCDGGDTAGSTDSTSGGSTVQDGTSTTITSSTEFTSYGSPYITMKLERTGSGDIYNASCKVHAMDGNEILDTASVHFASLGTIKSGQSATARGVFFDLANHQQYDSLEPECSWLDR